MIHETDLPCPECGRELRRSTVEISELSVERADADAVSVAVCPECGARYFPEETLSKLRTSPSDNR